LNDTKLGLNFCIKSFVK